MRKTSRHAKYMITVEAAKDVVYQNNGTQRHKIDLLSLRLHLFRYLLTPPMSRKCQNQFPMSRMAPLHWVGPQSPAEGES